MTRETDPNIAVEQQRLLETHDDFILLRRFEYSMTKALEKYPEGLPDPLIAQALGKPGRWVKQRYRVIVTKLRAKVAV